jgi:hypothetical protein
MGAGAWERLISGRNPSTDNRDQLFIDLPQVKTLPETPMSLGCRSFNDAKSELAGSI